jgi:hypothetical protein
MVNRAALIWGYSVGFCGFDGFGAAIRNEKDVPPTNPVGNIL